MKKKNLPYHKNSGFLVPSNYFEELDEKLFDFAVRGEDNSEKHLDSIEGSGFKVPAGYFSDLEEQILKKVNEEPKVIPLFKKEYFVYAASIAAIIIILAGSLFLKPTSENSWETLELSALESYIDDNNIDFSTPEISGFLFEDGSFVNESEFTEVNAEAMFEYLDENVDDPSFILD